MSTKASEIMGESVIAGVQLESQEAIKGMVGGIVGDILAGVDVKPASLPGDHEGIFYVAVGPTKVGFFSMKRGMFKTSVNELLIEHPRSAVQTVEIESGIMPTAHFVLTDGTHYALMCARINLGKLKKVRELFVTE